MPFQDVFLSPRGLAVAVVAVPIVLLYLIRPDPSRVELPTVRFLEAARRRRATTPVMRRPPRSLLMLLQVLAVLLVAASVASPYVPTSERAAVEETVLVVDTSASMATTADGSSVASGSTRFDRAVATAEDEVTETTSIVTTAGGGEVVRRQVPPSDAADALETLAVTDAPGDLRGAVSQARAIAGEEARIVVLSDFAGDAWTDAVASARAQGLSVDLRQFDGGGEANVGFVDRRFSGSEVTLSVRNFGDESASRTVELGDQQAAIDLESGDVKTVTFAVPAGGGRATLSPGDDFASDDVVYVAAPRDPTVDVLVVTNDRNRYLTTALRVADQIDVTVENPPTSVDDDYDVIVYSNVDPDSLLSGTLEAGRSHVADGGGVAVQAQPDPPDYGDLSLLDPNGTETAPTVRQSTESALTSEIDFQPPEERLAGTLREGRAHVEFRDGTPLIATAERDGGRLLYYGYMEERSSFKYNYQYPVFWKRAAFYLAGRQPLADLNHATGETARFDRERVEGPDGPVRGSTVTLRSAGFYETDAGRVSASLLDEAESDVDVASVSDREGPAGNLTREERRTVPRRLTEFPAVAALLFVLLEIAVLRRRGDL